MSYVLRRSLTSLITLSVFAAVALGFIATMVGAPPWAGLLLLVVFAGIQVVVNPMIIDWLIPASTIGQYDGRYDTDHAVGQLVAHRAAEAGVPLPSLRIVDDGTPNAFTYGRGRGAARLCVTRGLLERLDQRELDAVITHEIGHIRNGDFVLMTLVAVLPMVMYLAYRTLRRQSRQEARNAAIIAYVLYVISRFVVMALSRARELAADHYSCACTNDGDALASALVKIAYGIGRADADLEAQAAALVEEARGSSGKARQHARAAAAKIQARASRAQSMRALGIFDARAAKSISAAFDGDGAISGVDVNRAIAAMRWEVTSPWAKWLEKLGTHPLVGTRIKELEESGLSGRPQRWSMMRASAAASRDEQLAAQASFTREIVVAAAPAVLLFCLFATHVVVRSSLLFGALLTLAGFASYVGYRMRDPRDFVAVSEVTSLLERIDASPFAGIPVEVRGKIIGRGMPGYVLSPDLVMQDDSGFVALKYAQPIPFAEQLFGLFRAKRFFDQTVVARGWYRRSPQPIIELCEVQTLDGRRARCWNWLAHVIVADALILVGVIAMAWSAAH